MNNFRAVLLDVLVALIILIAGGAIFTRLAGVEEGDAAPAWVSIAPLVLAMLYLGWRTIRRGRQRREMEAQRGDDASQPQRTLNLDGAPDPPMDEYQWRSRVESSIRNLDRAAFEQFAIRILSALAIVDVRVERIAFDGAVECVGIRDDMDRAPVYAIARRSFGSLGANQIRDLRASMEPHATEAIFISNGEFSSSAIDEADNAEVTIELVDGEELLDLMHTNRMGLIFDANGQVVAVDEQWFLNLGRDEYVADGDER